jgi:micrococcal nuclease
MNIQKLSISLSLFFIVLFLIPNIPEARRGCCSHHGGVCGCQCCDGSPLSAKCALYYPNCNNAKDITTSENSLCEQPKMSVTITRIIDGDTIAYQCQNKEYKVRIIGIDTPETVHPQKPVQCFGKEATEMMKRFVLNQTVIIHIDTTASKLKDRDGRLLRYVIKNGEDIGTKMILRGFAFSYKKFPHQLLPFYNTFEQEAYNDKKGLWNSDNCNYEFATSDKRYTEEEIFRLIKKKQP